MKRDLRQLRIPGGLLFCTSIFLMLFLLAIDGRAADPSANYPSRPIELVNQNAPGGAADILCRVMSDIIKEEKILNQPVVVVNKAGSAGVLSYAYTFEKKGNPHVVLVVGLTPFLSAPLRQSLPYNHKSFTPIANLVSEGNLLVVRGNSPFKTIDDLIAEARKRPKGLIQGMGAPTSSSAMMGHLMQKAAGVQWSILPSTGEGEALINLLSGNVDFAMAGQVMIEDYVHTGKLRVLLSCTKDRDPIFKDAPSIKEAGLGEPVVSYRGLVGPPNMPEYAVRKLEAVFKTVIDHNRFKKYMVDQGLRYDFMAASEYGKFMDIQSNLLKKALSELGLLMKK